MYYYLFDRWEESTQVAWWRGKVMVRAPCCEKLGLKKGPWIVEEDMILISYINRYGHGNWRALPKKAGLLRCGKSCRLRWTNYLRPDIKRGNFSQQEEQTIIRLHQMLGNRWSAIAAKLPGRTDNEIKNVWHTNLKKRLNIPNINPNIPPPTKHKHKHSSKSPSVLPDIPQTTISSSGSGSSRSSELGKNIPSIPSTGSALDHQLDESFWSETLSSLEDFDFDLDFEALTEEDHVVRSMDHHEDAQCYDYEMKWFHYNVIDDVGELPAAVYY